jgi:2-O-(6-phospho-alpha-D-mannosyl)-D-glycerate hydrolase
MAKRQARTAHTTPSAETRLHFICNSHLDREWTMDFQLTRRLTVAFLDRLLEMFKRFPEYRFTLDSQTVPLLDYLEIRPERREELKGRVSEGRLEIGPWHTAPDGNCISGESIIRNLLVGHRVAKEFGGVMKVGYTPFGFGQVSQLPQIYGGFGIDTIFFYRGITGHDSPDAEFLWESPDGTRALCSRFGHLSRYNFFMNVYRPAVQGGKMLQDRVFDWWRDGGMPFKLATPDRQWDHYFLRQDNRVLRDEDLEGRLAALVDWEREVFTTGAIPMMQGMDTSTPNELEVEIVRRLQSQLREDEALFHSSLTDYVKDLRRSVDQTKLKLFSGEMRHPGKPGALTTIFADIITSRARMKVLAAEAEHALVRLAEPFATLAHRLGGESLRPFLDVAWDHLLKVHPHDTIAGSGIDQLERDATNRLEQVKSIANIVLTESLSVIQRTIDLGEIPDESILVSVFNPSPQPRRETVTAVLDFPEDLVPEDAYEIVDSEGKPVDAWVTWFRRGEKVIRDPADLTNALIGWTVKIDIDAGEIPALGHRVFTVRRGRPWETKDRIGASPNLLENEHLIAQFNPDGTLDLHHKATGQTFEGLHVFVDGGDNGDAWSRRRPRGDREISSQGQPATISMEDNGPLSATARVDYHMRIPARLEHTDDYHHAWRSEEMVDLPITSRFTLRRGARALDVETRFTNHAGGHRLRVLLPTGLAGAKVSSAESACDVVDRPIERGPNSPFHLGENPTWPHLRFVDLSDGETGLGLVNQGIVEFEAVDDPERTLALTLLRAYEVSLCTVSYRWERLPEETLSQQFGEHVRRYSLVPHAGDWRQANLHAEAERVCLPLQIAQSGRHTGGTAPRERSLIAIEPSSIQLSALKEAENGRGMVLRVFNPTGRTVKTKVRLWKIPRRAWLVTMEEKRLRDQTALQIKGDTLTFPVGKKQIVTVEIAV